MTETISWNGETKALRQFANDIKHNKDFITDIQNADRNNFYSKSMKTGKGTLTTVKFGPYDSTIVSEFFYQECFCKLLIAFNAYVRFINQHSEASHGTQG